MNKRTRPMALALLILLACGAAAWGIGGREDPLLYSDRLISEQKYDEAILYLIDFMKQYPDRFDAAQARMQRITKIRSAYNQSAEALIKVLNEDPTNQEKKLAMIRELEGYERVPNPAVKEFVARTKDLALFTYNRAKFEEIMAQGRRLIDSGSYIEAAKAYEAGFELYRPEFLELGLDQAFIDGEFERIASISGAILAFEPQAAEMKASFEALAVAYRAGEADAVARAWERARASAIATADTRRFVVDRGRELEASFARLSAKDETLTENSFLPFAYRLALGRRTEGRLEGVAGSIDAQWTAALGGAQAALDEALAAGYGSALAAFDRGDWSVAATGFSATAASADRGVALLSLWSHYAPTDLVERSTPLGQAALEIKGQDYLRFIHAGRAARSYAALASVEAAVGADAAALAAYRPRPEAVAESLAAFEARRAAFVESQGAIEAIRAASGESATRLSSWTKAGYGSESSQSRQGELDGRIAVAADGARAMETKAVASASAFQFGVLSDASAKALAAIEAGRGLLDGLPSDDPLLPDATFRYPTRALASLKSAEAALKALDAEIASFLASIRARPGYIAADASVLEWVEKARSLAAEAGADAAEATALAAKASEQQQLASSSRLEAERRLAESRTALRANNFETARERLDRSRERYLASLRFEQNPLLRAESDRLLSELAAAILKTENDLVVADTRRLVTSGKGLYLQGEFDRAESTLLQARSRWSATNSTPEVEVEY